MITSAYMIQNLSIIYIIQFAKRKCPKMQSSSDTRTGPIVVNMELIYITMSIMELVVSIQLWTATNHANKHLYVIRCVFRHVIYWFDHILRVSNILTPAWTGPKKKTSFW